MDYELLVEHLSPRLMVLARHFRREHALCNDDDLYQEALIHLWGQWRSGVLAGKNDRYVLQGCAFHIRNYLRKKYDRKIGSLDELLAEREDFFPSRESLPEMRLLLDAIRSHLDTRENILLGLIADGYTTREAGQQIGVSHVMVTKIMKKIRAKTIAYAVTGTRRSLLV